MGKTLFFVQLVQLVALCTTAVVPSVTLNSLNQPGAALAYSPSGTPISPLAEATPVSAIVFPSIYYVQHTSPIMIFQILTTLARPCQPYDLTYATVYGLNLVVDQCIIKGGDTKVPVTGVIVAPMNVGISIQASSRGAWALTFADVAKVLRGIYEITAKYGSYTLQADLFVGAIAPAFYGGRATVYTKIGDSNMTIESGFPMLSNATLSSA